jgi:uncharacterized OsmC-like protein
MASMTVHLQSIPETEAAMGRAGSHTLVVDRPDGSAGGLGLGFNGGQLLALAIGGCLCNDLYYLAHEMGIQVSSIEVDVSIDFAGSPLLATGAQASVSLSANASDQQIANLTARAFEISAVSNSLRKGIPIECSGP